ncbi:hypothetical protein HanXRQr2_Chr13g0567391 [Helianthus annuus]|uniref:Uncharacterized protein n=1 Tax=Helianthus annuus TaxID=4232 RepID=A0A9K3EDL3_HELAN|nr:hypothetical protein HanXRQr2_Chr13g0567391 [Helianthus annuus]KAJ0847560.1 hypothetical protein HanPSC8_Chr13g0546621 [Helianthus annuus]
MELQTVLDKTNLVSVFEEAQSRSCCRPQLQSRMEWAAATPPTLS